MINSKYGFLEILDYKAIPNVCIVNFLSNDYGLKIFVNFNGEKLSFVVFHNYKVISLNNVESREKLLSLLTNFEVKGSDYIESFIQFFDAIVTDIKFQSFIKIIVRFKSKFKVKV